MYDFPRAKKIGDVTTMKSLWTERELPGGASGRNCIFSGVCNLEVNPEAFGMCA